MNHTVDLHTKATLVRKQGCFSTLTDEEIEKLASLMTEKNFKSGDVIVTEGDPVDSFYIIISGTADIRQLAIINNVAENKSIATIGPHTPIGLNETGFYSLTGRRTATVVALTDMVTLRLSLAEFHGFALAYPHVNEVMRKNAEVYLAQNSWGHT